MTRPFSRTRERQLTRFATALTEACARPGVEDRAEADIELVGCDAIVSWARYLTRECGQSMTDLAVLVIASSLVSVIDDDEARSIVDATCGIVVYMTGSTRTRARTIVLTGDVHALGVSPTSMALTAAVRVKAVHLFQDPNVMCTELICTVQQLAYLRAAGQLVHMSAEAYALHDLGVTEAASVSVDDGGAQASVGADASQSVPQSASEATHDAEVVDVDQSTGEVMTEASAGAERLETADDGDVETVTQTDEVTDAKPAPETSADETSEGTSREGAPEQTTEQVSEPANDEPLTRAVRQQNAGCAAGTYDEEAQAQALSERAEAQSVMTGFIRDALDLQFGPDFGRRNPRMVRRIYRYANRVGEAFDLEAIRPVVDFYGDWDPTFVETMARIPESYRGGAEQAAKAEAASTPEIA